MKFEIITRCKNTSGETYKYNVIIIEQGRVVEIPKETLRNLSADVVNADWIESIQDFRAHKGTKIETAADKIGLNSKPVLNNKEELPKMKNDSAIGMKYINVCKKIRTFALQNRIQVEKTKHIANEGRNIELFEIIKSCGYTVDEFVRAYLTRLQPYELIEFEKGMNNKNVLWAVNIGYKVQLVIKVIISPTGGLVVSFHESNKKGTTHINKNKITSLDSKCLVITQNNEFRNGKPYIVAVIQKGFLIARYEGYAEKVFDNGVAVLNYADIKNCEDNLVQNLLNNIKSAYEQADKFKASNDISIADFRFPSLGLYNINTILFISDLYSMSRSAADKQILTAVTQEILISLGEAEVKLMRDTLKRAGYLENCNGILKLIEIS